MITLEFEPKSEAIQRERDGSSNVPLSAAYLAHAGLEMPVRLQVNGRDLLRYEQSPWYPVAIYGLAMPGLERIRALSKERTGSILIPGDGWLALELVDNAVLMHSSQTGERVRVNYDDLLEEWQRFARQVLALLDREFPELRNDPELGAELRTELKGPNWH